MTPTKLAQTAYGRRGVAARTARGTEYAVFARVTQRLQAAERGGPLAFPELAAALNDNRRLWTILVEDLADDGNRLPVDLRAGLVSLADFTFRHSAKVLAGKAAAKPLIEINAAVMRGLMERGAGE